MGMGAGNQMHGGRRTDHGLHEWVSGGMREGVTIGVRAREPTLHTLRTMHTLHTLRILHGGLSLHTLHTLGTGQRRGVRRGCETSERSVRCKGWVRSEVCWWVLCVPGRCIHGSEHPCRGHRCSVDDGVE